MPRVTRMDWVGDDRPGMKRTVANGVAYAYPRPDAAPTGIGRASGLKSRRETARRRNLIDHLRLECLPSAQARAKSRAIKFDITADYMVEMLSRQGFVCAVTGLPLSVSRTGIRTDVRRFPFRPSIDRIDHAGGYLVGNVRIVCAAVNLAMNEWGEDVFIEMAVGAVRRLERSEFLSKFGKPR